MAEGLDVASLASPITAGIGILETGIGLLQEGKANRDIKKYLGRQKAFKTPDEVFDILNATQNNMQGDTQVLDYLTNQTDQAFSSSLSAATRLGADPNALSSIFSQKVNQIMKIGADQHQNNMANYGQYLNALGLVADNNSAEQKSQNDINNNYLQAASRNKQVGTANVSGGINTFLGGLSAMGIGDLYNLDGTPKVKATDTVAARTTGGIPNMATSSSRTLTGL